MNAKIRYCIPSKKEKRKRKFWKSVCQGIVSGEIDFERIADQKNIVKLLNYLTGRFYLGWLRINNEFETTPPNSLYDADDLKQELLHVMHKTIIHKFDPSRGNFFFYNYWVLRYRALNYFTRLDMKRLNILKNSSRLTNKKLEEIIQDGSESIKTSTSSINQKHRENAADFMKEFSNSKLSKFEKFVLDKWDSALNKQVHTNNISLYRDIAEAIKHDYPDRANTKSVDNAIERIKAKAKRFGQGKSLNKILANPFAIIEKVKPFVGPAVPSILPEMIALETNKLKMARKNK